MSSTIVLAPGLEIPAESLASLCRRYRVAELWVFGSTARGDRAPDSDVDVLVEFEPGVVHGLSYFVLEQELAALIGHPVDLASKKWLKPTVRAEILRDARALYAA
jgi:predicted nucleotidyltransferase